MRESDFEDEPPFEDAPEPRGAGRPPIALRREAEDDDLENLLRPRRREPSAQQAPAVIDDFEHEPLDDDPLLPPRRESREPREEREERTRPRRDDDYDDE